MTLHWDFFQDTHFPHPNAEDPCCLFISCAISKSQPLPLMDTYFLAGLKIILNFEKSIILEVLGLFIAIVVAQILCQTEVLPRL